MAPHTEVPEQLSTLVREGSKPHFTNTQIEHGTRELSSTLTGSRFKFTGIGTTKQLEKWNGTFINRLRRKWGWIVTLSTFMLFVVTYGFIGCYGIIFVSLQEEFNRGATETGWVGSLAIAVAHFAGPFTNYLVLKLKSARRVVFIGVVFCFCGLIFSSIAPSIYYLFGTIGVAFGLGLNMVSQAALVLIVQYFPAKNSTRSVSVACTGLTIGMLVLSPVINYAMETIGWRATLRWCGGVILVIGSLCSIPMLPVGQKTKNMQRHLLKSNFARLKEDANFSKQASDMENTLKTDKCEQHEEDKLVENVRNNFDSVSVTKTQKSVLWRGKLWVLCGVLGFLRGPRTVLIIPVTVEMFGVHHVQQTTAVVMFAHGLGFIVGAFAMGLTFDKTGSYALSIALCVSLLISASVIYLTIPIWNIYKRWKQTNNQMSQEDEEIIEDCHVVPMSNLVARVREIVPILVGSQESLAFTADDCEYQQIPNYFDHSNSMTGRQTPNKSQTADNLIVHLTDPTDIVIHLPRVLGSDEIASAIPDEDIAYDGIDYAGSATFDVTDRTWCETDDEHAKVAPQTDSVMLENQNIDQCDGAMMDAEFADDICNCSQFEEVDFDNYGDCVDTPTSLTENPIGEHLYECSMVSCGDYVGQSLTPHITKKSFNENKNCGMLVVLENDREIQTLVTYPDSES
ncbi:monocarboxylate transporter 11-like isoform X2 [Amphiura filiformis]|uniref:monocarboxylate transporter 11-like isoform X2 n=1 Tax=Amphiura filiformis TaxID=82378 RepID=UPI003B223A64